MESLSGFIKVRGVGDQRVGIYKDGLVQERFLKRVEGFKCIFFVGLEEKNKVKLVINIVLEQVYLDQSRLFREGKYELIRDNLSFSCEFLVYIC